MDILNAIRGRRVYFDTNVRMYIMEGYPAFVPSSDSDADGVLSEISTG